VLTLANAFEIDLSLQARYPPYRVQAGTELFIGAAISLNAASLCLSMLLVLALDEVDLLVIFAKHLLHLALFTDDVLNEVLFALFVVIGI
jgi:hypothetical protein